MPARTPQQLFNEGLALEQSGDIPGAIKIYRSFLTKHRDHPNAPRVRLRAAQLCMTISRYDAAIALINGSPDSHKPDLMLTYTLAQACAYDGRLDDAKSALDRVLGIDPDYAPAIARLVTVLQYQGDPTHAQSIIDDALKRGIDSWELDHAYGQLAPSSGRIDDACQRITRRLAQTDLPHNARIDLGYLGASLQESLGDYNNAWDSITRANALKATGSKQTTEQSTRHLDRFRQRIEQTIQIFTPETLGTLAPASAGPDQQPGLVLVAGLPRSGTTLFEQILDAHPNITSAGETPTILKAAASLGVYPSPTIDAYNSLDATQRSRAGESILSTLRARSGAVDRVLDKHPGNDEHLGMLSAIAPGSTMILTRRDPRDTALSCYFKNFAAGHGWTTDLDTIVEMIEIRLTLHQHWWSVIPAHAPWMNLIKGDYEQMVKDPERGSRDLIKAMGLDWDDACLRFAQRKRIVPTLQPHQASQGVYRGSVSKWEPYREHLGASLNKLDAICERFGFEV